ncbi:sigma-54-dependent Fis family transcriptional regulator [Solimonas sp. K1W22B-7]|uniref:sigma-54-dependent transcriptional regulator n=1 Tax=Solimonas sp. K1W22B-7 TaxID=2303331 RepID=UPI000E330E28|nr:sigma-54 dependent transcriptional regulator [Solimonas sp. K1W22B-7]AXQ30925.1 sigma-54-dependent Fis family transcriptional regulator [Solimonas sp. K1W22B-7]
MSRLLIIEDEEVIRRQLARLLAKHGYDTAEAGSVAEAEALGLQDFDLVIADVRLPGVLGTEVIERARPVPVLIMTSFASIRSAVECMQKGAADYIAKPFDHDEMLLTIARLLQGGLQARQNAALKKDVARDFPVSGMVGDCAAMRAVADRIQRVAATDITVLIRGESGTGKELAARAIHERGARAAGPFIAVNCAAIPDSLIEAELFGHEKGAFTGATQRKQGLVEAAHGGTLFLDEVGELAPAVQARLLRVLQEGEVRMVGSTASRRVDVRLLAATHRDLEEMVRERSFREDLYYRLKVMELTLPPLRERGDDVERLARHLLERAAQKLNRGGIRLSQRALAAIRAHRWPGNVRELGNAVERAVILCDGPAIEPEHLAIPVGAAAAPAAAGPAPTSLEDYFRQFVLQNQERMNESDLAKALGISRKTLWERRSRMNLPRRREP